MVASAMFIGPKAPRMPVTMRKVCEGILIRGCQCPTCAGKWLCRVDLYELPLAFALGVPTPQNDNQVAA